MSKDRKWKKSEIVFIENYLTMNGDLVVNSGQNKLKKAIKDLPKNVSNMEDWCDKWLTEKGCKKLFKALKKDQNLGVVKSNCKGRRSAWILPLSTKQSPILNNIQLFESAPFQQKQTQANNKCT